MTLTRYALATVVTSVLLSGCGGPAEDTTAALQDRVEVVVTAANAGDWDGARVALGSLRDDVAAAQRLNAVTPEGAAQVLAVADAVEAGLPVPTPAPAAEPPAVQEPAAEPPAPEPPGRGGDKDDEEKDQGKNDKDD